MYKEKSGTQEQYRTAEEKKTSKTEVIVQTLTSEGQKHGYRGQYVPNKYITLAREKGKPRFFRFYSINDRYKQVTDFKVKL